MNFLNLLYQLLIAHKLSVSDFAAFNSLLSIFMIISAPLGTLQLAVAKFVSAYNAENKIAKIRYLLSDLFKKTSLLAIFGLLVFWAISIYLLNILKISSLSSSYIFTLLLATVWLLPVLSGGVQGLEFFHWFSSVSVLSSALKLLLAFILIYWGFNIAGALGALLASNIISIIIFYFPLKKYIFAGDLINADSGYKEMFIYLIPVATAQFCFIALVNSDMVLVKYFFSQESAGIYSLAQMLGKIFLFLPGAISIVMFPRISNLNAKNTETVSTLKKSLFYVFLLCLTAVFFYNLFPSFVFTIITGKVFSESILLGRLFSLSMSFFVLLYIFVSYFLSIKDLRFLKYLILSLVGQNIAIVFFHHSLFQVQLILCVNSFFLLVVHSWLVFRNR